MAFSDLVAAMDPVVTSVLADLPITLHFQGQPGAPFATVMLTKNPAMEEDYTPGSQQGTAILLLWGHLSGFPTYPQRGDTASVGVGATGQPIDYDIFQVDSDREGGGTLRLRQRSKPWNIV
jgi:hypothetical protein